MNVLIKIITVASLLCLFASCSFNKQFFNPTKVPAGEKQLSLSTPNGIDFLVLFEGDAHQPLFLKDGKDTIHLDFTIESVVFESSNGNNLNGWMLKPKDGIPTATILHFHGNAGFLVMQHYSIAKLLNYGFQVFTFDYSGYGFSEGKPTRKNVVQDGLSAFDYVKKRADVQSTQLVIYGQSLGGNLAATIVAERENEMDGVVLEGGFSSYKDMGAEFASIFGRVLVKDKRPGFKAIRNFNKPVLIIHSIDDEIVPFKMGEKLFVNANEPKVFYEIDECHICGLYYYPDSISQKIRGMLELK